MAEFEELRLQVSLTDNATAQLQVLKRELADLGGGTSLGNLDKLKRHTQEVDKAFRSLVEGVYKGPDAFLKFAGSLGAVGAAAAATGYALIELTRHLSEFGKEAVELLAHTARTGLDPAVQKQFDEWYQRMGRSLSESRRDSEAFVQRMNELMRGSIGFADEMRRTFADVNRPETMQYIEDYLNKLRQIPDQVERTNFVRREAQRAYLRELDISHDPRRAAEVRRRWLEIAGLSGLTRIADEVIPDLKRVDAELSAMEKNRLNAARQFNEVSESIKVSWGHIKQAMSYDLMTGGFGNIIRWVDSTLAKWDAKSQRVYGAPAAGRPFDPFDPQNVRREKYMQHDPASGQPMDLGPAFNLNEIRGRVGLGELAGPTRGGVVQDLAKQRGDRRRQFEENRNRAGGGGAQQLMGGRDLNAALPDLSGIRIREEGWNAMINDPGNIARGRAHMEYAPGYQPSGGAATAGRQNLLEQQSDQEEVLVENIRRVNRLLAGEEEPLQGAGGGLSGFPKWMGGTGTGPGPGPGGRTPRGRTPGGNDGSNPTATTVSTSPRFQEGGTPGVGPNPPSLPGPGGVPGFAGTQSGPAAGQPRVADPRFYDASGVAGAVGGPSGPAAPRTAPSTPGGAGPSGDSGTPGVEEYRIQGGRLPTEAELADKNRPAGERFNNPFNMWHDKWATQQGGVNPNLQITAHDRPAAFPSKTAGAAAAIRKMLESTNFGGGPGGPMTMDKLIQTWVGHGESYAPTIEKETGISRNTVIDRKFLNSDQGLLFLKTMGRYETQWQNKATPLNDAQWKVARDAALRLGPKTSPAQPGAAPQPGATPPAASASAAVPGNIGDTGVLEPNQRDRPGKLGGKNMLSLGGQQFTYATGGGGRGSAPYGSYPINIGDFSSIGAVASVGKGGGGGYLPDPKYPGEPRLGIQIHPTSGDTLENMRTAGCFGISRGQWGQFKALLLAESAKHPEGLILTLARDGHAYIVPRSQVSQTVNNFPANGTAQSPGTVPAAPGAPAVTQYPSGTITRTDTGTTWTSAAVGGGAGQQSSPLLGATPPSDTQLSPQQSEDLLNRDLVEAGKRGIKPDAAYRSYNEREKARKAAEVKTTSAVPVPARAVPALPAMGPLTSPIPHYKGPAGITEIEDGRKAMDSAQSHRQWRARADVNINVDNKGQRNVAQAGPFRKVRISNNLRHMDHASDGPHPPTGATGTAESHDKDLDS